MTETDPILKFCIEEAVKSMERREGSRSRLYLRAAHDYTEGEYSINLEIALENFVQRN